MRVLIVGNLGGQLSTATKIALDNGAKVAHVEDIARATYALRAGQGADLLMVDASLDIAKLIAANEAERIVVPVVACGVNVTPELAAEAIRAGAKEFIPLPPDADLIAAVLAAVADELATGGVTLIDSTGLSLLMSLVSRARLANGAIVLVSPTKFVKSIFAVTKLDTWFDMAESLDEAKAKLGV